MEHLICPLICIHQSLVNVKNIQYHISSDKRLWRLSNFEALSITYWRAAFRIESHSFQSNKVIYIKLKNLSLSHSK